MLETTHCAMNNPIKKTSQRIFHRKLYNVCKTLRTKRQSLHNLKKIFRSIIQVLGTG